MRAFRVGPWNRNPVKGKNGEESLIGAVAAGRSSLFAGPAPAVSRFATPAWRRTCGGSPAAGSTGSVLTAALSGPFSGLLKNAHLRRCPHPASLRRTGLYVSLLGISAALYLAVFEEPTNLGFLDRCWSASGAERSERHFHTIARDLVEKSSRIEKV